MNKDKALRMVAQAIIGQRPKQDQQVVKALELLFFKGSMTWPYFSHILFGLVRVWKEEVGTFAVDDKMRFYYSESMLTRCNLKELLWALFHEVMHLLLDHAGRRAGRDGTVWNMACDLVINQMVDGWNNGAAEIPDWVLVPEKMNPPMPKGLTEEEYYELFKKNGGGNGRGKGKGKGKGDKPGECEGDEPELGKGGCGSCAGNAGKWEDPKDASEVTGQQAGHSDEVVEYYRKATAEAIEDHVNSGRGSVPGGLGRWAKRILTPKVDYRRWIHAGIRENVESIRGGLVNQTYRRQNRRWSASSDMIMPGWETPLPIIGFIIDTSGSMQDKWVQQALGEVQGAIQSLNAKVLVVDVDSQVGKVQEVRKASDVVLTGGGGTDMREGYAALAQYKTKAHLIICVTDGDTPWPEAPIPSTKNLIVLVSKPSFGAPPEWATVIDISDALAAERDTE